MCVEVNKGGGEVGGEGEERWFEKNARISVFPFVPIEMCRI